MVEISVIIPTYGNPTFLQKSIESVLSQSFTDFELIVVDDNDPDTNARKKTEKIMLDYINDCRIHYIKHKKNMNGAVARNTGLKIANGRFVSFLDSDDEYKCDRLEKCYLEMVNADDKIAGVYTGCEFKRCGKTYHIEKNVKSGNFLIETLACVFKFCTGSNIFVRKDVIDELKGFDENFLRHQDYEFLVRLFQKYNLAAISEVLVIKNNENLNLPSFNKMLEIKKKYLKKFDDIIKHQNQDSRNYILHHQFRQLAESALFSNNMKMFFYYLKLSNQRKRCTIDELLKICILFFKSILKRK